MNDFNAPHDHKRREPPLAGDSDTGTGIQEETREPDGSAFVSLAATVAVLLVLLLSGFVLIGLL